MRWVMMFLWVLMCLPRMTLADAANRLVLTGSSTVAPLVMEIGKRFETLNPGVRVDVQTGGSSRGITDTRMGLADIGMVSRDLTPSENDLLAHTIALDGIAMIVHQSNPMARLGAADIISIYTAQVVDWRALNGAAGAITVVNKAEGRSTLELFLHHFDLNNSDIKPSVIIGDNQQGLKMVASNPNAIAYVSVGAAEYEINAGTPIKILPISNSSISNSPVSTRPLISRPLNLITHTAPQGLAKQFILFAQSEATMDLVADQYFVSISEHRAQKGGSMNVSVQ